jgi:hypothetical protein
MLKENYLLTRFRFQAHAKCRIIIRQRLNEIIMMTSININIVLHLLILIIMIYVRQQSFKFYC